MPPSLASLISDSSDGTSPQLSVPESFRWAICTRTPALSPMSMASRTASNTWLASSRMCEA